MALLTVRVSDELKKSAAAIYKKDGLSLSAAIRFFLLFSVEKGCWPFLTEEQKKAVDHFEELREKIQNNGYGLTLDEINEIIDEVRSERVEKENKNKNVNDDLHSF